jgi:hypothetical protein
VLDENGIKKTGQTEVMGIFTAHMTRRYAHIQINNRCIQELVSGGMNTLPMAANAALEEPITMDELITTMRKGKAHKLPGQDGICHEFYKVTWDIIKQDMLDVLNHMYKNGSETEAQKSGTLVCLPKKVNPAGPGDYRPLTLLNADHKLLTCIIANRLKPWMSDILQSSQHCGRQGNTIFEAVTAIRDIIAYTEVHNESVCLLTIDFKDAFDRISHSYLYAILREYGFSEGFRTRIQKLYANVKSTLNINGHKSQPISIKSSVRQGCPLTMTLFVICLNPPLNALEKKLTGIKIGRCGTKTSVIAYADDVTTVVSKPEDIPIVREILTTYEEATGKTQHPKIEGPCTGFVGHVLADHGYTIL